MTQENVVLQTRISWASVFAGVVAVLAISLLLSLLGVALGFSMLDPESATDITNGSGTAVTIWTILSLLISLAIGAFIAGRLVGNDGYIHGFLVWSLSLILGLVFSVMTLNSAARVTGNALSSMTSITGSVASGLGKGGVDLMSVGAQAFEELVPMPDLNNADVNIQQALQKSGIPELQPDYLKSQLEWAKGQIQASAKDLVLNPNNSEKIIQNLSQSLKARADSITSSIDRQQVSQALAANSSLTPQEAQRAVNNYLKQQDEIFVKLEENVQQAKIRYEQLKVETKEKAAAATNAAAKAALWSFFGLLIGLIVSVLAGKTGVKHRLNHQRQVY
jgi:hypothetical protein